MLGICLIGLVLAPWLLLADQPAPKPLILAASPKLPDLAPAALRADSAPAPDSASALTEDQSLLLVAPKTGPLSIFGQESRRGAELALKALGIGFNLEHADEEERVESQIPNLKDVKVALGHYSEKSLARSAPYYIHYGIPALLPYLENPEIATLHENFFQLAPDYSAQGSRLAQEVLQSKKPSQVVMLVGPERPQRLLADAFASALKKGLTVPSPGAGKPAKKLAPLSSKIKVHRLDVAVAGELAALKDLKGGSQDLVLLALPPALALEAGPALAASKFSKSRFLGGASLGLREVGAEYLALGLGLTLCLPVAPAPKNAAYAAFARRYEHYAKNAPTWPAVLAYDAATMAIKAASMGNVLEYLKEPNRPHQGLTASYVLNSGAPAQALKVSGDNVAFLP